MISINEIFEEYFIANPEQKQKFTVEEKVFDLFFKNGIGKVLKSPVDKENLIGRYLVELFHATQDSDSPIKAVDERGREYELGSGQIMNVFKPILKHYIEQKTIPENETGKKFFTVLSKVKKEKFGAKGKELNLQVAYAPVVGRFKTAIKELLDDLTSKINSTPPPVNQEELENIKKEVEHYELAVNVISQVISANNPKDEMDKLFAHGATSLQEAISQDQISQLVPNVLNPQSTKGSDQILKIDANTPEIEKIQKRIMLQLRLIGRRMDKLLGTAPKAVTDQDLNAGLQDAGIELDEKQLDAAKKEYKTVDKAAYSTGLLGYIKSLYRKGSKAFKDFLFKDKKTDKEKQLLEDMIGNVYLQEISRLQDSYEPAGYNITDDTTIMENVVRQLVKKPAEREQIIVDLQDNSPVFIQKAGGAYEAVSVQKIIRSVRLELKNVPRYLNFMKSRNQLLDKDIQQFAIEIINNNKMQDLPRTKNYYNAFKFYTGDEVGRTVGLIFRAVQLYRNSFPNLPEVKKRKTVRNLIHLIELEMRKHTNQANTKRIQHG